MSAPAVSWMFTIVCLMVIVTRSQAEPPTTDGRSLADSKWKTFVRRFVETNIDIDVEKRLSEKGNELMEMESVDGDGEHGEKAEVELIPTEYSGGKNSRKRTLFRKEVTGYVLYDGLWCQKGWISFINHQTRESCGSLCNANPSCVAFHISISTSNYCRFYSVCVSPTKTSCSACELYFKDTYSGHTGCWPLDQCLNGGVCNTASMSTGSPPCQCPERYIGTYCETDSTTIPDNCAFLNGGCEHICTRYGDVDNYYTCSCHTGYQLTADSHTCNKDEFEDPGECDDKNGGCAHICIVTPVGHMCACNRGHRLTADGISCIPDVIPVEGEFIDCAELFNAGYISTGVYNIKPYGLGSTTNVLCDQDTEGGGWTIFQRRLDGRENFYRNWNDYKNGFGSLYSEFWMGLDILYLMITENCDDMILRIELEGFQNEVAFAEYYYFDIGDEEDGFKLHIDPSETSSGLSEDAMYLHNHLKFYTYDESHGDENLAERFQGGWWYRESAIPKTCVYACLNQRYYNYELSWNPYAITWHDYRYKHHSWKTTAMKFRPSDFVVDCKKRAIC